MPTSPLPPFTASCSAVNLKIPAAPYPLHGQLRQSLLGLSYRAFLQCVIRLLSAQGYHAVAPAGRSRFKGRNHSGGWDMEAHYAVRDFEGSCAIRTALCIAQVKQFDALTVAQRQVDELRGCLVRAGADQALLITLSTFSSVAQEAAHAGRQLAPVRLIDGDELLDLLIRHQIGIQRSGREWIVDDLYFDGLEQRFANVEDREGEDRQSKDRREATRMASHRSWREVRRMAATPCPSQHEREGSKARTRIAVPPAGTPPPAALPLPDGARLFQNAPALRVTVTVTRYDRNNLDRNNLDGNDASDRINPNA